MMRYRLKEQANSPAAGAHGARVSPVGEYAYRRTNFRASKVAGPPKLAFPGT
jgi:hypothetical protein